MFSERRYARYDNDYDRRPTSALTWLLCALAAGFVIQLIFEELIPAAAGFPDDAAAFSPDALRHFRLWTLLSYALLHDTGSVIPWHLLANCLVIYFMGREVLALVGNKRFAAIALAAAAAGALLWFAFNSDAAPRTSLIGASAIAMALLVLFACFYPDNPITVLLFFVIPVTIRPKYLAAIAIGLDLLGLVFRELPRHWNDFPVAHSAHIGGALVAFGYYFLVHRREWLNPDGAAASLLPEWLRRAKKPASIATPKYKVNITSAPGPGPAPAAPASTTRAPASAPENLRAEVDRILDKINARGFASLTDAEKNTLDSAKDMLRSGR